MATSPATAPGDAAQHARLAVPHPFGDNPAERSGSRGEMRGDKGARGQSPPALSALPALKPNQPTHSRHAPMKLSTMLCGRIDSSG